MNLPAIAIVVAMAGNRVIGRNGGLPWRLPAGPSRPGSAWSAPR